MTDQFMIEVRVSRFWLLALRLTLACTGRLLRLLAWLASHPVVKVGSCR